MQRQAFDRMRLSLTGPLGLGRKRGRLVDSGKQTSSPAWSAACRGVLLAAVAVLLGASGCSDNPAAKNFALFDDRSATSQNGSNDAGAAQQAAAPADSAQPGPRQPRVILSRPISDAAPSHAAPQHGGSAPAAVATASGSATHGDPAAQHAGADRQQHVAPSQEQAPRADAAGGTPPSSPARATGGPDNRGQVPPPTPPSSGAAPGTGQVRLSAGTALAQSLPDGTAMFFSVDYEFLAGAPQSSVPYFLVIQSARGGAVAVPVPRLQQSGNLVHIMPRTGPEIGPFFAVLVQGSQPQSAQRISNSVELKRVGF